MKVRSNDSGMSGTPGGTPGETTAPDRSLCIYRYRYIYTVYYLGIPGETPEGTLGRGDRFMFHMDPLVTVSRVKCAPLGPHVSYHYGM